MGFWTTKSNQPGAGPGSVSQDPWELAFSRFAPITDPNDGAPVPTGVFHDRKFEYEVGIAVGMAAVPITNPILIGAIETFLAGFFFSPDGGVTFIVFAGEHQYAYLGPFPTMPPFSFPLINSGTSNIFYENTTNQFFSYFGDSGIGDTYLAIIRRRFTP